MKDPKDYYLTTAITYTSGKPHIGNTYEIILADAIARSKRQEGYNVYFQTGTDEHGQKIELKAQEAGIAPKQFVDEKAAIVKNIWDMMDTTYDRFMRTTDEYHIKQVQKIFKKLYDQGDIYLGHYEGKYCTACESFFTESQLVDGKCPDCGGEVHDAKEEAYFFKLSKYADRLIQHIEEHPEFIQPVSRKNEMMNNFLKPGLQDLCVSRTTFKWSIPVDFDPKHVVYVWIDALTNYITGLGYDVDGNHGELYKKYWPADLHLIGKDIVRFHTIYWPIMLMALDIPLPKQVFGHPWLLQGESKMSKSKGNVIYADDLVRIFGVDAVRYYVLHEIPYDNDGSITWDLLVERINSDLANILGNLVNRTIAMTNKYFDGVVTNPQVSEPVDEELKQIALAMPQKVQQYMDEFKASKALDEIFVLLRRTNKYIDDTMPWALAKDESKKDRLATVLYNLIEAIRFAAIALEPYMPSTSTKILNQINTDQRTFQDLTTFGLYKEGSKVTDKPQQLFARLDPKEVEKQVNALQPAKKEEKQDDNQITIDDFAKIELVVGTVEKCEKHPDADKLLVSQINIGKETRQIVSGIADFYTPEEMIGKKVIVVSNLKPAKLRGVESQGMILAGSKKKMLELVSVENLPNGTKIR
ncbi:methionine--tRNA ligase [Allocoprobacillus halotolerans]|uniref:Methionine--tRNA ligase n=1 Tax=Allocoprobacillus halotolerans TaxID=2944914 RepID=A0ABY5I4S1_9FIRM|nr:methionine--tRNA ligase [Allocoprobacillus halotolerans]UTY40346.1 methionine--tRNA ligase [Allocoprobacillus halotolerans]